MKVRAAKSSAFKAPRAGSPDTSDRLGQMISSKFDRDALADSLIRCIDLFMPPQPPIMFDRDRLRKHRDKAAARFSEFDFLKARASSDILERLEDTAYTFTKALDLGCHTGQLASALRSQHNIDQVLAADVSERMVAEAGQTGLEVQCVDEERLSFERHSFDLIVSALSLHWVNDLPGTLIQIRQALKPDGLFVGALFGAGTLTELRASLMEAEVEFRGGAAQRVSPLPGLQDMAGLMQRAGFTMPVVDVDRVTVRYNTPYDLLADLKGMGERAALASMPKQGLSRRILNRMAGIYAERFADPDGRLRASFDIIHLSGWGPSANQPQPKKPGSASVRLADALGTREIKTGDKP